MFLKNYKKKKNVKFCRSDLRTFGGGGFKHFFLMISVPGHRVVILPATNKLNFLALKEIWQRMAAP